MVGDVEEHEEQGIRRMAVSTRQLKANLERLRRELKEAEIKGALRGDQFRLDNPDYVEGLKRTIAQLEVAMEVRSELARNNRAAKRVAGR